MAIFPYKLPWLPLLFLIFSTNFVSSSLTAYQVPYAEHCASIIPESTQESLIHFYTNLSFPRLHTGFYSGGSNILTQNSPSDQAPLTSINFRVWNVQATAVQGLYALTGYMALHKVSTYYHVPGNYTRNHSWPYYNLGGMYGNEKRAYSRSKGSIGFRLRGFWSESSSKLCMVGSNYGLSASGSYHPTTLPAVLKLYNLKNSTTVSELITGKLESLSTSENDPNFFKPVYVMLLPSMNYKYSLVLSDNQQVIISADQSNDLPPGLPLASFPRNSFCSLFSKPVNLFNLRYSSRCSTFAAAKNCTPFSLGINYLSGVVSFSEIECRSEYNKQRLRALIKFPLIEDEIALNPNTTLVGEGIWDSKKNQVYIVACRFLNVTNEDYFLNARVGDCSTRLSLRYPSIWTMGNSKAIVGQIWSNKTVMELGYFDKIRIESTYQKLPIGVSGLKYEYTMINKAKKLCQRKKKKKSTDGATYPYPLSWDMRFDISFFEGSSKKLMAWGYSNPLFIDSKLYNQLWYSTPLFINSSFASTVPINVSYKIGINLLSDVKLSSGVSIFNMSSTSTSKVDISAEGIYDYATGRLCMTGCRNPGPSNQLPTNSTDPADCEIQIDFQFSPRNLRNSSGYIKGRIESTRHESDPLHFKPLDVSSSAYETTIIEEQISRMDVELIMVLISTTLACIFLGLQHFHVKRNPDLPPFMSFFMHLILTLGYMIPLMLNFEALFMKSSNNHQNLLLGNGGWFEANEVIVRVMTMIAFLLQFRLLQLTLSARSSTSNHNGIQNESWVAEKEAMFVALPLYAGGALITMFVTWRKSDYDHVLLTSSLTSYQKHRVWDALKSYCGLVLDGFLLPQILLNIFRNARENAVSCSFYIGTTFVRLLPHAYDLYTAQTSAAHYIDRSYIFVNPIADFYSTAWDVVISFGGLLFALVVFLQQRFGSRCILACTFRGQKVPLVKHDSILVYHRTGWFSASF